MGHHEEHEEAHNECERAPREAKLSHELIAGAAAFAAMKAYNSHKENKGENPSHTLAKELLAGFAGAAVDRIVETKGLSMYDEYKDKKRLKEMAAEQSRRYAPPQ